MLDRLTHLSDPVLYAIIFAVVAPFLGLFIFFRVVSHKARKHITLQPEKKSKPREKSDVIAGDPELVRIITHLAQVEKLTIEEQTQHSAKNKARLMLRLRKRIKVNFPEMDKQEVELFCVHLHGLAKSVARKKIK